MTTQLKITELNNKINELKYLIKCYNLELFDMMSNDDKFIQNYNKFLNCINYNTNRKITKTGKIYKKLSKEFEFYFRINNLNFKSSIEIKAKLKEYTKLKNECHIRVQQIHNENKLNKKNKKKEMKYTKNKNLSLIELASSICFNELDDMIKIEIIYKWLAKQKVDFDTSKIDLDKLNTIFIDFIISDKSCITVEELDNVERKYIHFISGECGLISNSKGGKENRILYIIRNERWIFDPTKKYFKPHRRRKHVRIIHENRLRECGICGGKFNIDNLFVNYTGMGPFCADCIDSDDDLNPHKWECLADC